MIKFRGGPLDGQESMLADVTIYYDYIGDDEKSGDPMYKSNVEDSDKTLEEYADSNE